MATKVKEKAREIFYLQKNIYEINDRISILLRGSVDMETGEITDDGRFLQHAEKSGEQKAEVIHSAVGEFLNAENYVKMVDAEIERLEKLKAPAKRYANYVKDQITKSLQVGETFEFPNCKIGWRKSSAIEVDEFDLMPLEELQKIDPKAVSSKMVYSLDKKYLTELAKADLPLPKGVKLVTKQNIQIK